MTMTPADVDSRTFTIVSRTSLRSEGYDVGEVDAFLDEVRDALVDLHAEHDEVTRQLEVARSAESSDGGGRADGAARTPAGSGEPADQGALRLLQHAQRTADDTITDAQAEAERLREDAVRESERVRRDATEEAARLREATDAERGRLAQDLAQRREEALGPLASEREQLRAEVRRLQELDARARERVRAVLSEQLRVLDAEPALDTSIDLDGSADGRGASGSVLTPFGGPSPSGPDRPASGPQEPSSA